MKFAVPIYISKRKKPPDFGDPMNFPLAPPSGQAFLKKYRIAVLIFGGGLHSSEYILSSFIGFSNCTVLHLSARHACEMYSPPFSLLIQFCWNDIKTTGQRGLLKTDQRDADSTQKRSMFQPGWYIFLRCSTLQEHVRPFTGSKVKSALIETI